MRHPPPILLAIFTAAAICACKETTPATPPVDAGGDDLAWLDGGPADSTTPDSAPAADLPGKADMPPPKADMPPPKPDMPPPKPDMPPPKPDMPPPQPDMPPPQPDMPPPPDMGPAPDTGKSCVSHAGCDDGVSCTQDQCVSGKCTHQVNPNFCVINSTCVTIGTLDPGDKCKKCQPTVDSWDFSSYVCTRTHAGSGKAGFTDGPAATARFYYPAGIAVGNTGEVYVADQYNHRIRMIYNGQVTTLAGSKYYGYQDGPALTARFRHPTGVAVGPGGEVYVADNYNHRIRMIKGGQVSTLAGTGKAGFTDGAANQARFYNPQAVATGPSGEVYVADTKNHRLRWVFNGKVFTLAGTGKHGWIDGQAAQAQFYHPWAVATGNMGEVYVADYNTNHVRMIKGGAVSTLAGSGKYGHLDGAALTAWFRYPAGLAVGAKSEVYVADHNNHVIRRIAGSGVKTFAGTATKQGYADSPAAFVYYRHPMGIAFKSPSTIYVADRHNHRVRVITW